MKKTMIAIVVGCSVLAGCATNQEYVIYSQTQQAIANARAQAEIARYQALADIAKSGDTTAKAVAAVSLQMSGSGQPQPQQHIAAPESFGDKALRWAQVLVPTASQMLTTAYTVKKQTDLGIAQSNNQAAIATSTNNTFASMNSNMATSNTAIANSGFTAVTTTAVNGLTATQNVATAGITGIVTTGANGLLAATNISKDANAAIVSVSAAANNSIQTLTNTIPLLQPNLTFTSTSTSTTTNSCGSNTSGGTLTCP